jgi:hypothetical protein
MACDSSASFQLILAHSHGAIRVGSNPTVDNIIFFCYFCPSFCSLALLFALQPPARQGGKKQTVSEAILTQLRQDSNRPFHINVSMATVNNFSLQLVSIPLPPLVTMSELD